MLTISLNHPPYVKKQVLKALSRAGEHWPCVWYMTMWRVFADKNLGSLKRIEIVNVTYQNHKNRCNIHFNITCPFEDLLSLSSIHFGKHKLNTNCKQIFSQLYFSVYCDAKNGFKHCTIPMNHYECVTEQKKNEYTRRYWWQMFGILLSCFNHFHRGYWSWCYFCWKHFFIVIKITTPWRERVYKVFRL